MPLKVCGMFFFNFPYYLTQSWQNRLSKVTFINVTPDIGHIMFDSWSDTWTLANRRPLQEGNYEND